MRTIGSPFDEYDMIGHSISWLIETKTVKPMKIKDRYDSAFNFSYPETVYWTTYPQGEITILKVWMNKYCVDFTIALNKDFDTLNKMLSEFSFETRPPFGFIAPEVPPHQESLAFAKSIILRKPKQYKYIMFDDEELKDILKAE